MHRLVFVLAVALFAAPILSLVLGDAGEEALESIRPPAALIDPGSAPLPRDYTEPPPPAFRMAEEDSLFRHAAEVAWRYVDAQYQPQTGLVNSVIAYPYATIWDVGSTLAAYFSAHELGLLPRDAFDERMGRALTTLGGLPLFGGAAFNKNYHVGRGVAAGRSDRESTEGYGWSVTDLGRLLVWLKIVSTSHPQHAPAVEAVVARLDFDRLVRDGLLWGEDLDSEGRRRVYQEGRLGYEQYAAAGFALWGHYADEALSVRQNGEPVEVLGVPLLTDRRSGAHLTSEPFLMLGLELGWWSPHWEGQAQQVLAAQQARFEATGQVTIASEDAVPIAPYYFYYYTIHNEGTDFAVVSLTSSQPLPGPRWISSKGAWAWYALYPSSYTWRAVQSVLPAADPTVGWSSGIFEQSGRPTGGQNVNTAAIILEAALFHQWRRPLLGAHLARDRRSPALRQDLPSLQ